MIHLKSVMSWFKKAPKNSVLEFRVPKVHFIGEQDGAPERELKAKLIHLFQREQSVKVAYLARAVYEAESTVNVVLCLKTFSVPDVKLVEKTVGVFASLFGKPTHMDVVFVNLAQEAELNKVCFPFFVAEPDSSPLPCARPK